MLRNEPDTNEPKLYEQTSEESLVRSYIDDGVLRLRFPSELEKNFRIHHRARASEAIRFASVYIIFLAIFIGLAGFSVLDSSSLAFWSVSYGGMILGLSLVVAMAHQPRFEKYQQIYTSVAGFVCIVSYALSANFVEDEMLRQFGSYQVMYLIFIVYTVGRLRTSVAVGTNLFAAIVTVGAVENWGPGISWSVFFMYFVLTNVVCAVVNGLFEHTARINFLQKRLLELEKIRLDKVSKELAKISTEDALTKLANRRHFDDVYQQEWQRCLRDETPLAVLLIDVDFFKHFNDHYGHAHGDECLALVGKTIGGQAFRTTDLVARYGGEEFVMVCPNTEYASARYIAQRIIESIDSLKLEHATSMVSEYVTVSIGVAAMVPVATSSAEKLFDATDKALYKAKGSGRHRAYLDLIVS